MGSHDGSSDEKPVHHVHVKAFFFAASEITVGQYRRCVKAGVCTAPSEHGNHWSTNYCNWGHLGRDNHPINCIDWGQARTFSHWVGGDLPTEAQWEYAARNAGQDIKYPWGNHKARCDRAIVSDGGGGCGKERTWRVCSRPKGHTKQGLCDISGSLWEWTLDEYLPSYQNAPPQAEDQVGSLARCQGRCDAGSVKRVYRGGCWRSRPEDLRVANRYGGQARHRFNNVGFRPRIMANND